MGKEATYSQSHLNGTYNCRFVNVMKCLVVIANGRGVWCLDLPVKVVLCMLLRVVVKLNDLGFLMVTIGGLELRPREIVNDFFFSHALG